MSSHSKQILHYRVVGDGHPVIFLHGFLESMTMWKYLRLPDNRKKIFVDLPGHGNSTFENTNYSMQSIANKILDLLCYLKVEKFDVVGHSMGGYVGLELMAQSDKCEKLILLNSNFWSDDKQKVIDRKRVAKVVTRNKKMFLYEAIPNLFLEPEKYDQEVRNLLNEAINISSRAIAEMSIAMSKRNDYSELVCAEKRRVLIVQGEEDAIVDPQKMKELVLENGLHYQCIEDCGHMGHIESAEKVGKIISQFLR